MVARKDGSAYLLRRFGLLLCQRQIFRNIVHYLAIATTSWTNRSALPRPLQECGEETCRPIGTCSAPITSERDQEAAQSTLAEDRPRRRIRPPPDGGRWWQILGHSAKLRRKEAAGNCRAAHSQNRGGGGPRGGPLVVTRSCGGPRSRHSKAAEPARIPAPKPCPFRRTSPKTMPKPCGKRKNHTENRHKSR